MELEGPGWAPLAEALDETMEPVAGAGEAPQPEMQSTASIEPEEGSDESDSSALDDWEWLRQNDIFSEDLYMAPRDSAQPDEWRARRETVERKLAEWEASPEGVALNAEVDALLEKSKQAHEALARSGAVNFDERTELIFKISNSGPVASGRRAALAKLTKEQLYLAWKAIEAVAKDRGKQLTRSYGNFDKLCGLGWLLGDVMLGRLIEGKDAYSIGRRLGKYASGLRAEFDAPLRRHGKRKFDNDEARERERAAAEEEEAELRRAEIEVGLEEEAAALAAAALAPAVPAAGSSEMPPPPPRVPPPPPPRSERVERLKLLREAEKLVSNAEGALTAANRARDQAKAAWEHARERYSNPHRSAQIPEDRWAAWDKQEKAALEAARVRYTAAERAIGEPEQALYWAKYEAKEARIELEEYEKAQRREGRQRLVEAQEAEKWEQIREMIAENHALHAPTDPEYWEPDAWEYAQLHRMWKLK
ncbi:hypothetical protein OAO87_02230 [bacterium]|nr:hypothetical protein [bacterium]